MRTARILISFKLAITELKQGWRHFYVFCSCLILGVAIMASVNTFGVIVQSALQNEVQSLLGGDIEIRIIGAQATAAQKQFIEKHGKVSHITTLRSMLNYKEQHTLVEIKAIDGKYPLIGSLAFNEPISKEEVLLDNGIAVDAILLSQLGLALGENVKIGEATYIVRATIKMEPDRAVQIFSFGARVIMSHASLQKSGLVSGLSLVEQRYRIIMPKNIIADEKLPKKFEAELQKEFPGTSWRVSNGADGNRTLRRFLDQFFAFMTLSGIATFLIAGIGIGSSVKAYIDKKSQTIAVLKVYGATRAMVFLTYAIIIGALSLASSLLGAAIGIVITTLLMPLLAEILPALKGHSGIYLPAAMLAIWYGILISYLFSIPSLLSAINVRPSLLFRSKITILFSRNDRDIITSVAVLATILFITLLVNSGDYLFITGAALIILFAFIIFWTCTLFVRALAKKTKVTKPWLKIALGNIHRPGSTTGTVIFAIGISLAVLIALTLTEANFQARIKLLIEEKAPSLFMIDIQPDQVESVKELLLQYAQPEQIMLFPMIRGRITKIAGKPVDAVKISSDIDWAVRGDRGLSYSATPPANANIVKGKWWPEDYKGEPLVSVDESFLKGMDVDIGDTITVNVLGQDITAKITSAREIDYSTFQMNFSMMLSPGAIESFPYSTLATIHLDKNKDKEFELTARMAKDFPGVTAIRTKELLDLVQNIMRHIAMVLRVTISISLIAGIIVLTSALSSTIEQRMYDVAILKVLGARRSYILKICTAEWMLLALITSLIAAIIGTICAWIINIRLRGQAFYLMPQTTICIIIACVFVIWVIGYIGNRRLFNFSISAMLRNE